MKAHISLPIRTAHTRREILERAAQVFAASAVWSSTAQAQTGSGAGANALQFGMVPYMPIQQMVRLYEPLTRGFEQALQRPCRLASATDFDQFLERARKGDFDIVGASPHVLRILQKEEGFEPLARSTAPLEPLVMVPKGSTVTDVAALRGQRVLVADLLAVHVLIALRAVRDAGVNPAKDLNLVVAGNQRNAITRMLKGDASAAVASASTLATLPPEVAQSVTVLLRAPKGLTPMGFLAHPRLKAQAAQLRETILQTAQTPLGRELLKAAQQDSYVALSAADLTSQDGVVTEFYRQRAVTRTP
jgi:phosphonate transport system substrate-binding protein